MTITQSELKAQFINFRDFAGEFKWSFKNDKSKYQFWSHVEDTFEFGIHLLDGDTSEFDSFETMFDFYMNRLQASYDNYDWDALQGHQYAVTIMNPMVQFNH